MSSNTISEIGRGLRSGDKLDALEMIGQIESFDEDLAREFVDDLEHVISSDGNAYTLLQALKQLRRISRTCPDVAAETADTVSVLMNETLADLKGDDPSESRKASWAGEILVAILDGTDTGTPLNIRYDDVSEIVKQGSTAQRAIGYRLLGRSATGEAVRILLGDFTHEMAEVREARDTGLDEAGTIVSRSVGGDGPLDRIEAIDAFSELYATGKLEAGATELQTVRDGVFERLMSADSASREQLLSAVERLARKNTDLGHTMADDALEIIATGEDDRYVLWELLQAIAKGAPSVVLSYGDEISTLLLRADSIDTHYGLKVIGTAARRHSSVPGILADSVLQQLQAEDKETVVQAIETVSEMGFYPPPDALEFLTDGNSDIAIAASKVQKELRKNRSTPEYVEHLRTGDVDISIFGDDSGDVFLKTRTGDGRWGSVDLGDLREEIVHEALRRVGRNESVPIVYPYYEPSDVVVLTLALVLEDFELGRQIGLYSPGSQTQWGMKGEIRKELRRFALSTDDGEVIEATPVPEIVTEAYVSAGEVKDNSDGEGPGRIVLTKKIAELEEVTDLDTVVLNSTSRARIDREESIAQLEQTHPETEIVSAHSYYTRNDTEGRPRYGPPAGLESTLAIPGADILDQVPVGDSSENETREKPWQIGEDEVRALSRSSDISITEVEAGEITALFDQLFEASMGLRDTDADGAGGLIFSRHLFFQRLPIPADDYDEWVRARYAEGDRFVPPLIQERIEDVEQKAGFVENLQAVQPLNAAKQLLERVNDRLRETNPMFEAIQDAIETARSDEEKLAIFSSSPKNALLIREVLLENDIVSQTEIDAGTIAVVSPDDIRKIGVYEKLLICGPLHPEHAGFYVHPRVEETEVLTYDRSWATMIERHATEYVDMLNRAIGGTEYAPFAEPELVGDIKSEDDEVVPEPGKSQTTSGADASKPKDEILAEAMRSVSRTEYREDSERYERELRHYTIETSDGETIALNNHESVLRKRVSGIRDEVDWVSVESLSVGDTLITLPDAVEEELWHEQLRELYEDELDADRTVDLIKTWYDALEEIYDRVSEELNSGGEVSDGEIYSTIHEWITMEVSEFDRVPMTVRKWFESVQDADNPMDLAENPSLILGPRSYRDIEAVGQAFGYTELEENAEEIEKAMEGFRTLNRREGSAHRDSIRDSLNSSETTEISEAASSHQIVDIRTGKPESESGPEAHATQDELDDELVERVVELAELAPTKNSELADAWGFGSGSELYQFLSTELKGYHERNDDELIVPTEKAMTLIEKTK